MDNIVHNSNDYKKRKADSTEPPSVGKFLKLELEQQIETAVQKINWLKSMHAPQNEVIAAIKEFETLIQSEYQCDKNLLFKLEQQIQTAVQKIRELKAIDAPQNEVKTAVDKYIQLRESIDIINSMSQKAAIEEFKTYIQSEYQRDKNLLFTLERQIEPAIQKIRELKATHSPQNEVTTAVDKYIQLRESIDIINSMCQ